MLSVTSLTPICLFVSWSFTLYFEQWRLENNCFTHDFLTRANECTYFRASLSLCACVCMCVASVNESQKKNVCDARAVRVIWQACICHYYPLKVVLIYWCKYLHQLFFNKALKFWFKKWKHFFFTCVQFRHQGNANKLNYIQTFNQIITMFWNSLFYKPKLN